MHRKKTCTDPEQRRAIFQTNILECKDFANGCSTKHWFDAQIAMTILALKFEMTFVSYCDGRDCSTQM
jgi:hypothetical protein